MTLFTSSLKIIVTCTFILCTGTIYSASRLNIFKKDSTKVAKVDSSSNKSKKNAVTNKNKSTAQPQATKKEKKKTVEPSPIPLVITRSYTPQEKKTLDSLIAKSYNKKLFTKVIEGVSSDYVRGLIFLLSYMPKDDQKKLHPDVLIENINYAYKVKEEFPWCRSLPENIFFNYVLPYHQLSEHREKWRKPLYEKCKPLISRCKSLKCAMDTINRGIARLTKVDYTISFNKPDQAPLETMEIGAGSWTSLSILLADAFRSVGIPARIVGIPSWHNNIENHSWVEVWINGVWYFTEYYPDGGLNGSKFIAENIKRVSETELLRSIYAASYSPTTTYFPLVWNLKNKKIRAENITEKYVTYYGLNQGEIAPENFVRLYIKKYKSIKSQTPQDRISSEIIVKLDDREIERGKTYGPKDNDILVYSVKVLINKDYTLLYDGRSMIIPVKQKDVTVNLYDE